MKSKLTLLITVAVLAFAFAACNMEVNDPVRSVPIFEPYISVQPVSQSFSIPDYAALTEPLSLEVDVWEWDAVEGSLSYQWYTFTTLEDFFKGDAAEIPGATAMTYAPNISSPSAGDRYYYYVEVSNINPSAIGVTQASIKSDVAIISFSAFGDPLVPEIIQNPVNASYTIGRTAAIAPLDVRVSEGSGAVRYQWYKLDDINDPSAFDADGIPQGTPIPTATQRTYLPEISALGAGDNFYYVLVSNVVIHQPSGVEIGRSELYSIPAVINMVLGDNAAPPRIEQQPRDLLYFVNEDKTAAAAGKLSVGAVSLDGGDLTYQWFYKNTKEQLTWTQAAAATTTPEHIPDISTASAGTRYYMVEVTNTNTLVTEGGNTVEMIPSKMVTVKVQAAGSTTANATITVNPDIQYQYIRGYGGMYITWGNFYEQTLQDTENMHNPDILGFNIMRVMIPPSNTNIQVSMDDIVDRLRPNYYENAKIVNKYGGYILASPWSPPKEWKSNNSINSGGILIPRYYPQFADYLRSYARLMSDNGAPIYAISIANEPNYAGGYDGCEWTPNEMRDFFKQVGRFTQGVRGWGGGRATPTVLTMNGESANHPDINYAAMNDSVSSAAIDLFARHVYGEQTVRMWGHPNLNGREVWMTEHNINSASEIAYPNDSTWNYIWRFMNDVDLVIRMNNENAFVWWASKRFYSFIGDGAAGTQGSTHYLNGTGSILPRGWGLAHYSKFTIDNTRVAVSVTGTMSGGAPAIQMETLVNGHTDTGGFKGGTSIANVNSNKFDLDNTSVRVTAYISQDGNEINLVMWTPTMPNGSGGYALGDAEIQMPAGFKIRSASAMRSTAASGDGDSRSVVDMGKWENVEIASTRDSVFVNLPRSQILSVKVIKE